MWSTGKLPNLSGRPSAAPSFTPLSVRASREGSMLPTAFPFQQLSGKYLSPLAAGTGQLPVTCWEGHEGERQSWVAVPSSPGGLLQPVAGRSEFSTYPSPLPACCSQALCFRTVTLASNYTVGE